MKRNDNLKTLSWEHHNGLVISFRIKQGLTKNIKLIDIVEYIIFSWETQLEHHFWQEEQIFPELLFVSDLIVKMKNQHEQLRKLIGNIKINYSVEDVQQFAEILNNHIRFEEKKLFPAVEQNIDREKLEQIGDFLRLHHKNTCEIWNNQFWKV